MAPGVKDPRKMKAFISAVRQGDELEDEDVGNDDAGPFDWNRW
jgi:hypothetical protein